MRFSRLLGFVAVAGMASAACSVLLGIHDPQIDAGASSDAPFDQAVVDSSDAAALDAAAHTDAMVTSFFCDTFDSSAAISFCDDFDHHPLPIGWDALDVFANGDAGLDDASLSAGPFLNRSALRFGLAADGGSERCDINRVYATSHARWRIAFDARIDVAGPKGGSIVEAWGAGGGSFRALAVGSNAGGFALVFQAGDAIPVTTSPSAFVVQAATWYRFVWEIDFGQKTQRLSINGALQVQAALDALGWQNVESLKVLAGLGLGNASRTERLDNVTVEGF